MKLIIVVASIVSISAISWLYWPDSNTKKTEEQSVALLPSQITEAVTSYHSEKNDEQLIPQFTSEQERVETMQLRRQMLPVFLEATEKAILDLQQEIAADKKNETSPEVIVEKEKRLQLMQLALAQTLERNQDIH
jgi:predicted negative regulator of RcsB-dependent stress response